MLTLNLDRLGVRSLSEARPNETPFERHGGDVGRLRQFLHTQRPFVANLHGVIDDPATWAFTKDDLAKLQGDRAYEGFIEICLSTYTIIFVGISVNDIAVGGHLERAAHLAIENPTHYWITPVKEFNVSRWGEDLGIRVIRYDAPNGDHAQLGEALAGLANYESRDAPNPPRVHLARAEDQPVRPATPPEHELLTLQPDEIRQVLNAYAEHILRDETPESYEAYDRFSAEYDQAIYQAWYVRAQEGKNRLLGYEIQEHRARGAFGTVYRARAPSGETVAIKILLDEIRQQPESLRAFRRGVRSMRILDKEGIGGMVTYREASEIPAFVVMDWIEGPNLAEARSTGVIADWYAVLDIALQLAQIIRSAHMLPARVLHRDIRPANVMLKDYWLDQERRDVVVLDFDLSWHRGSAEKSIVHATSNGYLAPEQLRASASTRSALVDSFGIAMTLYFLCGGKDPLADQQLHETWEHDVCAACTALPSVHWVSLPSRISRLIFGGSNNVQSRRWDLSSMIRELALLNDALHNPAGVSAPDLLAEEVAARTHAMRNYTWDDHHLAAVRVSATGLRVALRADAANEELELDIEFADPGGQDRAKLNKQISEAASAATQQLGAAGWKLQSSQPGYAALSVKAVMPTSAVAANLANTARDVDRILGRLKLN